MDIETFKTKLAEYDKSQLLVVRENAKNKNEKEFIDAVEAELDRRYPDWNTQDNGTRGRKPTKATFFEESNKFPSEIEAFVWLVEKMIAQNSSLFEKHDWQLEFVAKGSRTIYFSKDKNELFRDFKTPVQPSQYHKLKNGWYLKTALSRDQKYEILCKLSAALKLSNAWSWHVIGEPEQSLDSLLGL